MSDVLTEEDYREVETYLDFLDARKQDPSHTLRGVTTLCDLLERNPDRLLVLKISKRGYMGAVRRELERRIEQRRTIAARFQQALFETNARAAEKSQAEKKRAVQTLREWHDNEIDISLLAGSDYSDLFWTCGAPRFDPQGARPLSAGTRELTRPAFESTDPDPVADIEAMVSSYREGRR